MNFFLNRKLHKMGADINKVKITDCLFLSKLVIESI